MKKVLVFSHEFPPAFGGAGTVAAEHAQKLANKGYDVTVLTCNRSNDYSNCKYSFKVLKVNVLPKFWFLSYAKSIDFDVYDYILLNDPGAIFTAGLFFSKNLLKKCIVFLHGTEPDDIFISPSFSKKIIFFKRYYLAALMGCRRIISVSEFMKAQFLNKTKLFELKEKILVFYTSVSKDLFYRTNDNEFKLGLGLPLDVNILLSVGRLVEKKGYKKKLNIFKRLIENDTNTWHWLIVGDGEYLNDFMLECKKLGLSSSITIIRNVDRTNLAKIYSSVDLFWLLSDFEESFGLVYLESLLCGCPVIANNHSGPKEIVSHNINGFLVNSECECLDILSNKSYKNILFSDMNASIQKFYNKEIDEIFK